ncbi:MAG: M20 family metallopeptidase [Chloroflexota bacterium]
MDVEALKSAVIDEVDAMESELVELSLRIHRNPEIAFEEVKSSAWLAEYLEGKGFAVDRGICELPTAFKAAYGSGSPVVALLAEYDALPDIGHACGHNIIGTSAVGAAAAGRKAVDEVGGTVMVVGSPAEEAYGGKVFLTERGAFDGVDAAMIVHPHVVDRATTRFLALIRLGVEFFGKAAHAASDPEKGVNALEAMIQAYNGINSLRQHIPERDRIHGIITHGGEAPNIVPAYAAGEFLIRAETEEELNSLKEKVLNCFKAASLATGARLEHRWFSYYAPLNANMVLAELFADNLGRLGRTVLPAMRRGLGSSDVGNVSTVVPTIHPVVAIAPQHVTPHTPGFAEAAASEEGHRGLLDGAKAMAMTVVDLIAQPEAMQRVKDEFAAQKASG